MGMRDRPHNAVTRVARRASQLTGARNTFTSFANSFCALSAPHLRQIFVSFAAFLKLAYFLPRQKTFHDPACLRPSDTGGNLQKLKEQFHSRLEQNIRWSCVTITNNGTQLWRLFKHDIVGYIWCTCFKQLPQWIWIRQAGIERIESEID